MLLRRDEVRCLRFGWLTATGSEVLLTALLTAAGTAFGLAQNITAQDATANAQTIGIVGGRRAPVGGVDPYFCGGYVAGGMARFSGAKQGVGVWLWAVVVAVVVAVLSLVAGARFDVLANLNGFPASRSTRATSPPGASLRQSSWSSQRWPEPSSAAWLGCGTTAGSTVPSTT